MARKVFISVLGFTNYRQCIYVKDDYKSRPVRFVQEATLEYLGKQDVWNNEDISYILLTKGAELANWEDNGHRDFITNEILECEGLHSCLKKMELPFKVETINNLPDGNTEEEIWEIFQRVFDKLQDSDELYFDLTHGFRYLPMLVMALINYSKFLKKTSVKSITYGNFESRDKVTNEAALIDLLSLSMLQDWTFAAGQFLDSGNVQSLVKLNMAALRPILIRSEGKDEEAKTLKGYTNYLNAFVEDMQTCRGMNILKATNLKKMSDLSAGMQSTFIKPLNPVFDKIRSSFASFDTCTDTDDDDRLCLSNPFHSAKWCADNGLYQQAITILHEGIQTIVCNDCGFDKLDVNQRRLVASAIALYIKGTPENQWSFSEEDKKRVRQLIENKELQRFASVYSSSTQFRNDLNHSGMRPKPLEASNIKKGILRTISQSLDLLKEKTDSIQEQKKSEKAKSPVLINLSNHPSNTWGSNQIEAARAYGEIMDMPFPEVNEKNDESYISALSEEYLQKILDLSLTNSVTVHLMGELTFTFALLRRLQEYGIECIASTSKRIVNEDSKEGKKEVVFQFERFRRYE